MQPWNVVRYNLDAASIVFDWWIHFTSSWFGTWFFHYSDCKFKVVSCISNWFLIMKPRFFFFLREIHDLYSSRPVEEWHLLGSWAASICAPFRTLKFSIVNSWTPPQMSPQIRIRNPVSMGFWTAIRRKTNLSIPIITGGWKSQQTPFSSQEVQLTADPSRHVHVAAQVANVEREPVVDQCVDEPVEVDVERLLPHVGRLEQAQQVRVVLLLVFLLFREFQLLLSFLAQSAERFVRTMAKLISTNM